MDSDKQLYQIFQSCPQYLMAMVGRYQDRNVKFEAKEFKKIERHSDGFITIEGDDTPRMIIEFEMNKVPSVYNRLIMEMTLAIDEEPERSAMGVIMFPSRADDPGHPTWNEVREHCHQILQVLYLDQELAKLLPDHPLRSVFEPYLNENLNELKANARTLNGNIHNSNLNPSQKKNLESVFTYWMSKRFTNLTVDEVINMTGLSTPIEETTLGKELLARGKEQGDKSYLEKGLRKGVKKGRIEMLEELRNDGLITQAQFDQKVRKFK